MTTNPPPTDHPTLPHSDPPPDSPAGSPPDPPADPPTFESLHGPAQPGHTEKQATQGIGNACLIRSQHDLLARGLTIMIIAYSAC